MSHGHLLRTIRQTSHRISPIRVLADRRQYRQGLRFYRQFIGPGQLCFDIGANVGSRTRLFRELGATVVAVEPQQACIDTLEERFGQDGAVSIVGKAIGASPGVAELAISATDPTISTMSEKWRTHGRFSSSGRWEATQNVEVATLDSLIAEFGSPSFCKIDVEGFERQVLEGLSQPIRYVSFEFTQEFLDDARGCVSILARTGPLEAAFSIGESMKLATPWMEPGRLFDALTNQAEPRLWGDIYARSSVARV
jgi:FkbM family methyltransferase